MSDKKSFDELVAEAARRSDASKSAVHDFIKDMVAQIHAGLLEQGKVNIAQLGKFERHQVDEKEGYNPQTDEKMTIPAHNKAVFKPYKSVREVVNAPYGHMKPHLIEPEQSSSTPKTTPSNVHPIDKNRKSQQSHETARPAENQADRNSTGNLSRWIGAGIAFAAAVGTWFWLNKDDE